MTVDNTFFKRLRDSDSLTDVLIQMEDFMDGLDIYVFKNWIEGEVVEGPEISRYWTRMTLKYAYDQMPDPSGGLRLLRHGAKISYKKAKEEVARDIEDPSDYRPEHKGKPILDTEEIWLVDIMIPRRFIDELSDDDLELEADEADISLDNVSDARDENIDGDEAIHGEADAEAEGGDVGDEVDAALDKLG